MDGLKVVKIGMQCFTDIPENYLGMPPTQLNNSRLCAFHCFKS